MRIYEPLDHFDYYELDVKCSCYICKEWRSRRNVFQKAQALVANKKCSLDDCSVDMKGSCADCRSGMQLRLLFHASNNRRDLYSECSWHASEMEHPELGKAFMAWITKIINNRSTRRDSWWVGKAPYLPVQFWLTMFRVNATRGTLHYDDMFLGLEEFPMHSSSLLEEPIEVPIALAVSGMIAVSGAA